MTTWLLVDFPCLAWTQFYGRRLDNPTDAVRAALAHVRGVVDVIPVFCFDVGPYRRAELFPGYKAARERNAAEREMQTLLGELPERLCGSGTPNVLAATGYEADDFLARAAWGIRSPDRAIVYTRDKDLYQVLNGRNVHRDPVSGVETTYGGFRREWYIHPFEWSLVKAIAGCATDGIPGVSGVAEITAAKYVSGRMSRLLPTYNRIRTFEESPEYARNRALVTLAYPGCPTPELVPVQPDWATLYDALGFTTDPGLVRD